MAIKLTEDGIGSEIRCLREINGVSQSKLATSARTSQAHISRIEGGDVEPSWKTVLRCLEGMGYTLKLEKK